MKFLTAFCISIVFCFSVLPVQANDRKEPDYFFYEAVLSQAHTPSKLQKGLLSLQIDVDETFMIVSLSGLSVSGTVTSISLTGPTTISLPAKEFSNYKASITQDQAEDIRHGLYYVEVRTSQYPDAELRGQIRIASKANPEPKRSYFDMNNDNMVNLADIKTVMHDISLLFKHEHPHAMKPIKDIGIHALPESVTQQLKANLPTLVSQYVFYKQIPDYKTVRYQPRAVRKGLILDTNRSISDPKSYSGWDILSVPTGETAQNLNTPVWIRVSLSRPASVGIVWFGTDFPDWLKSWNKTDTIEINNREYSVFTKQSGTTTLDLGSIGSKKLDVPLFLILFAEADGAPSKLPITPDGLEEPKPNELCPAWVHDQYVTKGPDGVLYATWHQQIDSVFWCYFGHEHGSDPSHFDQDFKVPFGYAGHTMGMNEKHVGFKVYIWDDKYGYRIMALQHQGTSSNQAVCGQHHELDFFIKKANSDEILSKQYFAGDYGVSRSLVTGNPLTNSKCPDQSSIQNGGARFLPLENERQSIESWVVSRQNIIGFNFSDFVVSTDDSVRLCKDYACDEIKITTNSGSLREISYVTGLGPISGIGHRGTFYTDPTGTVLLSKHDKRAVEQYIKPGFSLYSDLPQSIHLYNSTHCYDVEGFGSLLTCGIDLTVAPSMRENSIQAPN